MASRNGEYTTREKGRGHYIVLSTEPDIQQLEIEICKTLGLRVEDMHVSLGERRKYEPRKMVGPLDRQTANERRRQINQNVNLKMHPPKKN